MLETYAADVDVLGWFFNDVPLMIPAEKGTGEPACRCYRCGKLMNYETMEVDRIVPGCMKTPKYPNGGTYVRENIRPACWICNKVTGNEVKAQKAAKRKKRNEQARARRAAA